MTDERAADRLVRDVAKGIILEQWVVNPTYGRDPGADDPAVKQLRARYITVSDPQFGTLEERHEARAAIRQELVRIYRTFYTTTGL